MTDKIRQWLRDNAILLPFIAMGLVIIAQALGNQLGVNQPQQPPSRVEVAVFQGEQYAVNLYQEDEALVAEIEQTISQAGRTVKEKKVSRFPGAFKTEATATTAEAAQEAMRARYRDYLPQLARYQRTATSAAGNYPAFGVAPYSEVRSMTVNGQPVQQQRTYQDGQGQTWYVWFYEQLQLNEAANTIEFTD